MATDTKHPRTATVTRFAFAIAGWLAGLRGAAGLRAKTPDQREDIGLTLRDLQRMA